MIRGIAIFFLLWFAIAILLHGWRKWTKKEIWSVLKIISYAGVTAGFAVVLVISIVFLF